MSNEEKPSAKEFPAFTRTPRFLRRFGAAAAIYVLLWGGLRAAAALAGTGEVELGEVLAWLQFSVQIAAALLGAWLTYWLFLVAADWTAWRLRRPGNETFAGAGLQPSQMTDESAEPRPTARTKRRVPKPTPPRDWKDRLKAAQLKKDGWGVIGVRDLLSQFWNPVRMEKLDRRLAAWFTRHFQVALRTGKGAEVLPELERVAEVFAYMPEFRYFGEILPTVRQCAELKASIERERNGEDSAGPS